MSTSFNQQSMQLLKRIESSLSSFKSSNKSFSVLSSLSTSVGASRPSSESNAKSLFILDSSYNPPSRAHFALAYAALTGPAAQKEPKPQRLLLLFSTQNADKPAKPASFEQRVAMMGCLAEDLIAELKKSHKNETFDIDIGLTTLPYYVGKTQAIESSEDFSSGPRQIHIIGYDTVTRFLAPKYYPDHQPPLSALKPYFGNGHGLLVALRPTSSSENMQDAGSEPEEDQKSYIAQLGEGAFRNDGFQQEWAQQISVLQGSGRGLESAVGVSSTAIRNAEKTKDWQTLEKLCTPSVARWIREQRPYDASNI